MYGDQFGELVCSYWDLHSGGNRKCLYQRGVRIKRVEFRGNLRAFFLQGRSKLSVKQSLTVNYVGHLRTHTLFVTSPV